MAGSFRGWKSSTSSTGTGIRAHGGAMPVFGTLLEGLPGIENAPDSSPVFADDRILALVDYLETIQQ